MTPHQEPTETWKGRCELILDHTPMWGGDGFFCSKCGEQFFTFTEKAASERSGHERGYAEGKKEMAKKLYETVGDNMSLATTYQKFMEIIDQTLHQDSEGMR